MVLLSRSREGGAMVENASEKQTPLDSIMATTKTAALVVEEFVILVD